jgi:hypothetical protein
MALLHQEMLGEYSGILIWPIILILSTYVSVYVGPKTHSRISQSTISLTLSFGYGLLLLPNIVPPTSVITYSVELSSKLGNSSLTLSVKYEVLIENGTKKLSQNYPPVDTIQQPNILLLKQNCFLSSFHI